MKKWALRGLSLLVSAALLTALLTMIPLKSVTSLVSLADHAWIVLAVLASFVAWFLMGLKWQVLAPGVLKWGDALSLSFRSLFYGFVLPGQVAGDAYRTVVFARRGQLAIGIASILMDRVLGLAGLLLLGLGGALGSERLVQSSLWPAVVLILAGLLVATGICVALALYGYRSDAWLGRVFGRGGGLGWIGGKLQALVRAFRLIPARRILVSLALSVVFQTVCIVQVVCVARSIGISIGTGEWSWIFALASLMLLLPVSIGGIGIREGSLVALLDALAISREHALACSLLLTAIAALGALLGGLLELRRAWHPGA